MRRQLVNMLVCPICNGDLKLKSKKSCGDLIIEGSLKCQSCALQYAIRESIPNLLPPGLV
ncbi:Trm112 family protein [SAR202 cluster bacterium AC-409-J13_OGT_754m]|nr:Trm112 family protein [SAR202 cluster bacterium AC-409-J13_OGT_754m]